MRQVHGGRSKNRYFLAGQEVHSDEVTLGCTFVIRVCHTFPFLARGWQGKLGKIVETLADMERKREEAEEKAQVAGAASAAAIKAVQDEKARSCGRPAKRCFRGG